MVEMIQNQVKAAKNHKYSFKEWLEIIKKSV